MKTQEQVDQDNAEALDVLLRISTGMQMAVYELKDGVLPKSKVLTSMHTLIDRARTATNTLHFGLRT